MIYFLQFAPGGPIYVGTTDTIARSIANLANIRNYPPALADFARGKIDKAAVLARRPILIRQMEGGSGEVAEILRDFLWLRVNQNIEKASVCFGDHPDFLRYIKERTREWDGDEAARLGLKAPRSDQDQDRPPVATRQGLKGRVKRST